MTHNKKVLDQLITTASQVILGKEQTLRLALTCLLARGHLLIEDLPGMGKTTLAHLLAKLLGLEFQRVQFTSDMLPADILGASIYDTKSTHFRFIAGPLFTQLLLADEINRTTPKTQSALLEAMEEQQVTIEGQTHKLPQPFFVIATQNPSDQIGTFALPESQLDRFLMRIAMGYPDALAERALLKGDDRRQLLAELTPHLDPQQLLALQAQVTAVHLSDALVAYIQTLLAFSRETPYYHTGLSPRAGLALKRAAQAWALLADRDYVIPEDVQAVLPHVVGHRLRPAHDYHEHSTVELVRHLTHVALPL